MLVLLLFTAWATLHPHHKHTTALTLAQDAAEEPAHPHQQQQHVGGAGVTAWVAVIVVMVLVLAIVAAAQMLVRLRRHQTEVELVDDMMV
jgi:Ca2+/H+ antiporter